MYRSHLDDVADNPEATLDEGWWASVLADEQACEDDPPKPHAGSGAGHSLDMVDWQQARDLYERDEVIHLEVYGFNRGGVLVHGEKLQGFVPISHLLDISGSITEENKQKILAGYVGRTLELKIIECEESQDRIVFSERAALAGEGRRKELFSSLQGGDIIEGTVTNVIDFGAFVDLGGVEGLIHVSELSWGRVQHPCEILRVGQRVRAMVLSISEENGRVALSLKRLLANPWEEIIRRYRPGDVLPATITKIMKFGAFARLKEGVEGLIHISTIPLTSHQTINHVVVPGQEVQVKILHVDALRRRLGLELVELE
ncbi:MAG TPA: S1 RNA-binding domain-containing protein [Anaerolineaceae bacterium]